MPRQSFPGSSALSSADYDEERQELTITFTSGRSYTYRQVPSDIWDGLQTADSPGRFWNSQIKDQFS
jgi:hypothetical protein